MHTKVNFLVERSLGSFTSEPEFKNPFAPSNSVSRSLTPSGGLGPLQPAPLVGPAVKSDELAQLSNRINSLTTSVGQLLALQTQQHVSGLQQTFAQPPGIGPLNNSLDIAPNQNIPLNSLNNQSIMGHGLPNRPDLRPSPRAPNPPMRTWSAGTLELPMRGQEVGLGRPDPLPRDKRRSVAGLMRRDSAGVSYVMLLYKRSLLTFRQIPDSPSESWTGQGPSPREPGPVATKWEHLPLAPELLRSLNKFGCVLLSYQF